VDRALDDRLYRRGDDGYEAARCDAAWNARIPERFPEAIVRAAGAADVRAAVRFAKAEGLEIGVCSGGHSWAANHVRDGGLLLDVSRLDEAEVDADGSTASVGPGVRGNELVAALFERGLHFPVGHCPGVALGGYLLQGGYGWNGRVHGPACMSVDAIEMVTADGELVRASESENPGLLWAARGAGPGFFAAVTRFHLRLYEAPKAIANAVFLYPIELLDEVFRWAHEIGPRVARIMELMLFIHRDETGEPEVAVTGPVLAASGDEAAEALAVLETCPVVDRAKLAVPNVPATFADLYAGAHAAYPDDHRYWVDNMWTHASIDELLPGLRRIAGELPAAPSHMLWMNWGPSPERPDMAYSVEDETYIALYAVGADESSDEANHAWATENMRAMEPLATGIQLADENLGHRPARFASGESMRRLDELRAAHDPDGLFYPWMGRSGEALNR
jgi:FAD/FMN-containing dehydrogenase